MNYTFRTFIMLLIGFVVCLGVFFTLPIVVYKPRGILLPLAQLKAPTNRDKVRVFGRTSFPSKFSAIGWVNIELHSTKSSQKVSAAIIKHAREIVAKNGGNGLLINLNAHTLPNAPESISIQVLRGMAIHIPSSQPAGSN